MSRRTRDDRHAHDAHDAHDDRRRGRYVNEDNPPRHRRGLLRRLLRKLIVFGVVGLIAVVGISYLYIRFAPVPKDRLPVQTTFIFDSAGHRLAALSGGENREVLPLAQIPVVLQAAVLAAEDRRFYKHRGVDPVGIARALYQDVRRRGRPQGGSTITQQYVKNAYVGRDATLARKLKEAAIAVKLEQKLTKDQILERYLNTIYFGRGAYGVQAASRAYFRVGVNQLDLPRVAYLAAVIRSPERTDAIRSPDVALRRRNSVLDAMVKTGAITPAQAENAKTVPVAGPYGVRQRRSQGTTYDYPDAGTEWFIDAVRRELVDRFGEQAVLTQGLKVKTSLDLAIQKRAYQSAYRTLLPLDTDPAAAVVVLDHSGRVKALVGGRHWDESKVNLALGASGGGRGRPGGSTFKPFVLEAVLHGGYTLESAFNGPSSLTIEAADSQPWTVRNTGGEGYGLTNLIDATRLSINTVFAQAVNAEGVGPDRVAEAAASMGVTSELAHVPSIALGTSEVSPLEMANAYLTLANRGMRATPSFVVSATAADGRALSIDRPGPQEAIAPGDADAINTVLSGVVTGGTGRAAAVNGRVIAGKTGTTNDYRDAWFIGYTAKDCCVTAVWMGYPDGAAAMSNVHGIKVSGGTLPARLFASVMALATAPKAVPFATVKRFSGELLPGAARVGARSTSNGRVKTTRSRPPVGDPSAGPVPIATSVVVTVPDTAPSPPVAPDASTAEPVAVEAPTVAPKVIAVAPAEPTASTVP